MWRTRRLGFYLTSTLRSRSCPGHVRKSQSCLGSQESCFQATCRDRPSDQVQENLNVRHQRVGAVHARRWNGVGSLRRRFGGIVQDGRPCWELRSAWTPWYNSWVCQNIHHQEKKFIQIAQLTVNFHMHNKKTFKNKFILRSHINWTDTC